MKSRILFTSAGRRNQLIECFREDARSLGIELKIYAADMQPHLSPACHAADDAFEVPRVTAPDYIECVLELCKQHEITLLVPTIDPELLPLAEAASRFENIGTRVVISHPDVFSLAGDKKQTAEFLARHRINTPQTRTLSDFQRDTQSLAWPVIIKPSQGSASVGIIRPQTLAQINEIDDPARKLIVQELWQGREYTVNVFADQQGRLRAAVPHLRLEVRAGEVSKGRTEHLPILENVARRIVEALPGPRGPLCFQAIVTDDGAYAVFEINARFGGGYPLAHHAGAPFSKWLLEEAAGMPPSPVTPWQEGLTMLRFDTAVFR